MQFSENHSLSTVPGCRPDTERATLEMESPSEVERAKNWLENAIPMDVITADSSDLRDLTNALFDELLGITFITNNMRFKMALRTVLLNLELHGFKTLLYKVNLKPVIFTYNT
jgi:hypothetical protein